MGGAVATPGVPFPAGHACFFLDFDGTLVDHAPTPGAIHVPPALATLLQDLHAATDGALAIITGRALADIDRHLAPLRLPTAAVHGAVHRTADGRLHEAIDLAQVTAALDALRAPLHRHVAATPGLLLEDKDSALAVHFRRAPHAGPTTRRLVAGLLAGTTDGLELLDGNCVVEVRPAGADKGRAVAAFLREPPFAGRQPVCIGDDLTDLPALRLAQGRGGLGIAVGERLEAPWRLGSPAEVRAWLQAWLRACRATGALA